MLRVLILSLLATPAAAVDYEFCWVGANGYRMAGTMTVEDAAVGNQFRNRRLVTEESVLAFEINGFQDGKPLGSWSLDQETPQTSWHLNFDPVAMVFPTGGSTFGTEGQQWNASGRVNNCGTPGFGFNSGNGGQDVCVDDVYRVDSLIDAKTPFFVYPLGDGPSCIGSPLLGSLLTPRASVS
ncbi:hypothetical protein L0666_12605 [Octadecabacter sp. CECT 8868]|uniref:hypothetical protein n=1 Tax=Octadecabacter algicola TaxID=2909342 RepID=UPI001F1DEE58|nr:hypothetical protein [Octadecabacter algicola]MCF2905831.1 hypothetical protein [Octadecabacter algicola]